MLRCFYEDSSLHLSGSDKASRLFETASIEKDLDLEMEDGLVFTTNPNISGYYILTALKKEVVLSQEDPLSRLLHLSYYNKKCHVQAVELLICTNHISLVPLADELGGLKSTPEFGASVNPMPIALLRLPTWI